MVAEEAFIVVIDECPENIVLQNKEGQLMS